MGVYVIAPCFLENICQKKYITEVLLPFTQENNLIIGIDKNNLILDTYQKIAENKPSIAYWIDLMTMKPSSFKKIAEIDNSINELIEYYLFICSLVVNQQKMIIFDYQNWKDFNFLSSNEIEYNGSKIQLFDKDEAIEELKPAKVNVTNINDSVVATEKSIIKNIKK